MKIGPRLVVATHNPGKLDEMRDALADRGFEVVSAGDLGLPEPVETGTSFAENARIKAHAAAQATGLPALADDSGLEVAGLGGAPGVYTADWTETPAGRDFGLGMDRVYRALVEARAPEPWTARFCATLVLARPGGGDRLYEGVVEGVLKFPPRGSGGHGYDPIFHPEGLGMSFAEMPAAQKAAISHRARALAAFVADLDG